MTTKNISSALPLAGGTLTGNLLMSNGYTPSNNLDIATKLYVDNSGGGGVIASIKADELNDSSTTFVNPGSQIYHKTSCKAWVDFTDSSIVCSYGVTSVTKPGTAGQYRITWITAFTSANYSTFACGSSADVAQLYAITATYLDIKTYWAISLNYQNLTEFVCVEAFGDI